MAYKFQVGPAQLSGALTQEGTIEVRDPNTGVLVAHATDAGEISASADLKAGGGLDVEGNADIEGEADIRGAVKLAASGLLTNVRGTLSVKQEANFLDNVTLGFNNADRVIFEADVSSSLLPSDDSAFDIGADLERWANIYGDTIVASQLSGTLKFNIQDGPGIADFTFDNTANVTVQVSGAADLDPRRITMWSTGDDKFVNSVLEDDGSSILTLDSNYDFEATRGDIKAMDGNLSASANIDAGGDLEVAGDADIGGNAQINGTLDVFGEARFDSHVTLGNNVAADIVEYKAAVSSSIFPSHDITWDLGSSTYRWNEIYGKTVYADSFVGNISFDVQRDNGTFLAATDLYIVTGSASAVTLPSGEQGKVIRIKREASGPDASTSDVTLSAVTGESFDDGSPIVLETAGAAITCVYDGVAGSGKWYII